MPKQRLPGFAILALSLLWCQLSHAQPRWLPLRSEAYITMDRLEILRQNDSTLNLSAIKPVNNEVAMPALMKILSDTTQRHRLSVQDLYNIRVLLTDYRLAETYPLPDHYVNSLPGASRVDSPLRLFLLRRARSYLHVDPLVQAVLSKEGSGAQNPFLLQGGAGFEGVLAAKLSMYGQAVYGTERGAGYQQQWIRHLPGLPAVPGEGAFSYVPNSSRVRYWDFRGGLSFKMTKYIDATLGYDKNFIGNGYRSFIISDFSSPYLFFRLNTRIWKFNYENLYARLTPQANRDSAESGLRKFLVLHHLDIDVTRWLNLGVFEAVVMGRSDHIDFTYLPPVLFIKGVEFKINSPDKVNLGFDFKANAFHRLQVYGQFVLNEFVLSEMLHQSRGWWGNKYAYQAGLKYINVLGVHNLDIQLESNRARPYTFEHFTLTANFSNYNQPLLHPLGANFQEYIAVLRYQPWPCLRLEGKMIHYFQGLDTAGVNMGSNVMANYVDRPGEYGFQLGAGNRATCTYLSLAASYELCRRLFIDLSFLDRQYRVVGGSASLTRMGSLGIRLNLSRREYDY